MEIEIYGIALVPLVVSIIEVTKQVGLPTKLAPLLALFLGLGSGFVLHSANLAKALVTGVMIGLSASGLYSVGKTILGK